MFTLIYHLLHPVQGLDHLLRITPRTFKRLFHILRNVLILRREEGHLDNIVFHDFSMSANGSFAR